MSMCVCVGVGWFGLGGCRGIYVVLCVFWVGRGGWGDFYVCPFVWEDAAGMGTYICARLLGWVLRVWVALSVTAYEAGYCGYCRFCGCRSEYSYLGRQQSNPGKSER